MQSPPDHRGEIAWRSAGDSGCKLGKPITVTCSMMVLILEVFLDFKRKWFHFRFHKVSSRKTDRVI